MQNFIVFQASSASNLMSTIFPGIPFPSTVFPPLIDMSSTQALVTLVNFNLSFVHFVKE